MTKDLDQTGGGTTNATEAAPRKRDDQGDPDAISPAEEVEMSRLLARLRAGDTDITTDDLALLRRVPTASRLARIAGVSPQTVRNWIADGDLDGANVNGYGYVATLQSLIAHMTGSIRLGPHCTTCKC